MNVIRIFAGVLLAASVAVTTPAAADEAAERYIQGLLDEAEPYLDSDDEDYRYAGVEKLVDKYVDMRKVGYFALGKYARRITDEQRDEYMPLFAEYASSIYQEALTRYSGEKLSVANSVDRSERDIIVNSRVVNASSGDEFADVVVHWRVYRNRDTGELSLIDAGADGIWLAIEQQETFGSIIANNGGPPNGIDALIEDLREKVSE